MLSRVTKKIIGYQKTDIGFEILNTLQKREGHGR
jgi:hypothetical protein